MEPSPWQMRCRCGLVWSVNTAESLPTHVCRGNPIFLEPEGCGRRLPPPELKPGCVAPPPPIVAQKTGAHWLDRYDPNGYKKIPPYVLPSPK